MNQLRSWFDANKVQPAFFKLLTEGFEIRFATDRDAALFAHSFGRPDFKSRI